MGRKIPGKKHRGIKDPDKQRLQRFNRLKGKINAPPANIDVQEVPRGVQRIIELKAELENGGKVKPEKRKKEVAYKRFANESDKRFLHRVNKACRSVMQEKAFENKYKVDIKRNPSTGEVEKLIKRKKDNIEQFLTEARKKKKTSKAAKQTEEPKLTKSHKRRIRLKEKKLEKNKSKEADFPKQDVVKFGEVAYEPPVLNLPKRVQVQDTRRPGAKDLLLKSLVANGSSAVNQSKNLNAVKRKPLPNTKAKWKVLPHAERRRLERRQMDAVSAYRDLKKRKGTTQ